MQTLISKIKQVISRKPPARHALIKTEIEPVMCNYSNNYYGDRTCK